MKKLIYIAGPYRHRTEDGEYDTELMRAERQDELLWAKAIAEAGHIPLPPLAMTCPLEEVGADLLEATYIANDLELIGHLPPAPIGCLLLRPGVTGSVANSIGAQAELAAARQRGLSILDASDPAAVEAALNGE